MYRVDQISELLYLKLLTRIRWDFFGDQVELLFGDSNSKIRVLLSGVCAFTSRQHGPDDPRSAMDQECEVQYVAIHQTSEFLTKFLGNTLGFETGLAICDSLRRTPDDERFESPRHFVLSCDAGNLDIIFREIVISDVGDN